MKTGPPTVPDEFHQICGLFKNASCKYYLFCLDYVLALGFANWVCVNCPHRRSFRYVTVEEVVGSYELVYHLFAGFANAAHGQGSGKIVLYKDSKGPTPEPTYRMPNFRHYQPPYSPAPHEMEKLEG
jgi:hypothetical protein